MDAATTTYYQKPFEIRNDFDYMLRIKQSDNDEGEPYISFMEEAPRFAKKYLRPFVENSLLSHALKNLWLTHQYNQEYTSFLLKTRSKKEFLSKAGEYVRPFQEFSHDQLAFAVTLLLDKLAQPLTSPELSLLLNVDPTSIDSGSLPLREFNPEHAEPGEDV